MPSGVPPPGGYIGSGALPWKVWCAFPRGESGVPPLEGKLTSIFAVNCLLFHGPGHEMWKSVCRIAKGSKYPGPEQKESNSCHALNSEGNGVP